MQPYSYRMSHAAVSPDHPRLGHGVMIAFLAGVCVIVIALIAQARPSVFAALPVEPVVAIVLLSAVTLVLREYSMRAQFARQAARHRASLTRLEEKNRWLTLTEAHARVGHWRLDLRTDEVYWSKAVFAMHGLPPGEPPDLEKALAYFHADDRDMVSENVERARETGLSYTFRARINGADGQQRHVAAIAQVEKNEEGTPIALFGVLADRTVDEQMQRDLRNARDNAHALAQAKGTFLARMSHEIRTPMNGVLGFAELLGQSALDPQQRRHTDLIIESGQTLQTLLNDILDLSKIEAGRVEINPGVEDIRHLVYRVTQLVEPAAREKNIRLAYHTAPDLPRHMVIDALRLRQILGNLLSNAVRHTDEGRVSLDVRCVEGKLCLSVSDTGIGISDSMKDAIFDPFTQDNHASGQQRGGTGLGLAISRQLAELMNGSLTVRSEPGKGSVFTLTLPLVGADAPARSQDDGDARTIAAHSQSVVDPIGGEPRILLAEDYDINRELITDMARRIGIAIECAEDGAQAVAMVQRARETGTPYALVLMDLQMPRMNGLEAARTLREAGIEANELPIIALTANAFADDVKNCLVAGMQEHLAKPVSMDALGQVLTHWISPPNPSPGSPSENGTRQSHTARVAA